MWKTVEKNSEPTIRLMGDQALMVELGESIHPEVFHRIRRFCDALGKARLSGVTEWVPAYTTVTVYYDPMAWTPEELAARLKKLGAAGEADWQNDPVRTVVIPVLYGGRQGPDLAEVARMCGLSEEEVIRIHAQPSYRVYMMGFVPGFPYLGGMSPRIAAPRLASPRSRVPAGSVGIAGEQTGIYPLETPGGWRIIGRTPLALFDPHRDPPALLRAGDRLRFRPVTEDEYEELLEAERRGELQPEIRWTEGEEA